MIKARVKTTGEIVEIFGTSFEASNGMIYDEVDLIIPKDEPDYWEKLKHQAAISAMSAFLIRGCNPEEIAQLSFELAVVMVNRLKEGEK